MSSVYTEVQINSRPATCSHSASAGQELCYLCHQRALRNVPVDASKDKKDHETLQDKLLLEYQQQKDLLALAKEQAARMKTIGFNRDMASFNLEAAQRTKVRNIIKVWVPTETLGESWRMRLRQSYEYWFYVVATCTVNSKD